MARNPMVVSKVWAQVAVLTFLLGFTGLGILAVLIYAKVAPIPARVVTPAGTLLFDRGDIQDGQNVFQRYGLMQHGTLFGHGAYLGPDFTAQYLHEAALDMLAFYGGGNASVPDTRARVVSELRANRYDPATQTLYFGQIGRAHV